MVKPSKLKKMIENIEKITEKDLIKYNLEQLIYIYLYQNNIPKYYDIDSDLEMTGVYNDFIDFISKTKKTTVFDKFISECRWFWDLIPLQKVEFEKIMPKFSYFKKPIKNIIPRSNINLVQLYEVITTPKYAKMQTEKLRRITDKKEKSEYKANNFDYVCFSGVFSQRNSQSCINESGLICLDFDHVENLDELKEKLKSDINIDVQLMFVSPSGDGLKVVCEIDKSESFLKNFIMFETYFLQLYNIQVDKSGKNIDRACFICFDENCYINDKNLSYAKL